MSIPNIQISVNQPQTICKIRPMAFITILLHAHRYWKKESLENEYAYGILIGNINGSERIITEAVPITHSKHADLVFDESFYKDWDDLNSLKEELESSERCIGWYKVIERDMKFRAPDIRNQVKIQTLHPQNVALLLDPRALIDDQEYGFSVFHLIQSAGIFHEMCDYERIPWEVLELGNDVDKVVNMLIEMVQKYSTEKPFVEEINEVKTPEIPQDSDDDDSGEYITPDIDPNQPFFF